MEPLLRDDARGFGHVSCHAVHTHVCLNVLYVYKLLKITHLKEVCRKK